VIKLFGDKLNCAKLLGLHLVSFGCFIDWLIDWLGNRRKEIYGSGR
jgi:hypothetical protein